MLSDCWRWILLKICWLVHRERRRLGHSARDATPRGRVLQRWGSTITEEWREYKVFSFFPFPPCWKQLFKSGLGWIQDVLRNRELAGSRGKCSKLSGGSELWLLWEPLETEIATDDEKYNKVTKRTDQILLVYYFPSRSHFKKLLWCTDFTK